MTSRTSRIDAPFVLVHGMFHGGWCWRPVSDILLERSPARVYAPTLTGLGDRAHLLNDDVGFDTHVQDVVSLLEYEDLKDVTLVGHSYGGSVVHAVSAAAPDRVGEVVYLDSSHFDVVQHKPGDTPGPSATPVPVGPNEVLCYPVPSDPERWGIDDPDVREWFLRRLVPQPVRTRMDARNFTQSNAQDLPCVYIACTVDVTGAPIVDRPVWQRVKSDPLFRFYQLAQPHEVLVTAPSLVAELLIRIRQEAPGVRIGAH